MTGTGAGTLTGENVASTWSLDGTPTYSDGTGTLAISGFGTLQGGTVVDTFTVTAPSAFTLKGREGDDTFELMEHAVLTGAIVGGDGSNTLKGPNARTTWTITGPDQGDIAPTTDLNNKLVTNGFMQIGSLTGGSDVDVFVLVGNQARLSGALDGGSQVDNKTNTLQGPNAATTWTISDTDRGGLVNQNDEKLIAGGFVQVGNLIGGDTVDAFILNPAHPDQVPYLTGSIDGGNQRDNQGVPVAMNRLQGPNLDAKWTVTGPTRGTVTQSQ